MTDHDSPCYAVRELHGDVKEIKKDVKSLMIFMAVEKAFQKRRTYIISFLVSLVISLIGIGVGHIL